MKTLIFAVVYIFIIAIVLSERASADDVYNFYWQKESGPQTVNQGIKSREHENEEGANPSKKISNSSIVNAKRQKEKITGQPTYAKSKWQVSLSGLSEDISYMGSVYERKGGGGIDRNSYVAVPQKFKESNQGIGLGIQYNYNVYLAGEGSLGYLESSGNIRPFRTKVGVMVFPLNLRKLKAIKMSLLAGATTSPKPVVSNNKDYLGYIGFGIDVFPTPDLAVQFRGRRSSLGDSDMSSFTLGMSWVL